MAIPTVLRPTAERLLGATAGPLASRPLIIVLGCMRSGSTLLTQLMVSHPAILGYGETHLNYDSPTALGQLARRAMIARPKPPWRVRFLLDKVLHPRHLSDLTPLSEWTNLKVIVIVREPDGNVASLKHRFAESPAYRNRKRDPDRYYAKRLRFVADMIEAAPTDLALHALTYEDLTGDPVPTLERLQRFLALSGAFGTRYSVSERRDTWGVGDGSPRSRAGTILPARDARDAAADAAWNAHGRLCEVVGERDLGFEVPRPGLARTS